jgi:hypothetical protein
MRRSIAPHPDQLPLKFESAADLERLIEARVAARCEAESICWRFQLVTIETLLMTALVAIAGAMLGQPTAMVVRASLLIGISCFATGLLLLGLSAWSARLLTRFRRWRVS